MRTNFWDRQTDGQTEKFNTISLRFTGDNCTARCSILFHFVQKARIKVGLPSWCSGPTNRLFHTSYLLYHTKTAQGSDATCWLGFTRFIEPGLLNDLLQKKNRKKNDFCSENAYF